MSDRHSLTRIDETFNLEQTKAVNVKWGNLKSVDRSQGFQPRAHILHGEDFELIYQFKP